MIVREKSSIARSSLRWKEVLSRKSGGGNHNGGFFANTDDFHLMGFIQ
jgi:hypothetical protein